MPPSEEHRLDEDATGKPREDGEDDDQGKKEDDGESSHTTTNENGKRPREPRLFSVTYSVSIKKGMAAFFLYARDNRDRVQQKLKNEEFGMVAEALMQEFKALSDSEREEWDRKVFESGINFVEEMKKYKLAGATTGKNLKDGASPRKNMTAFLFFSAENRERIIKENPDATFGDIAKVMAVRYRELPEEAKLVYINRAKEDRERYLRELDEYVARTK